MGSFQCVSSMRRATFGKRPDSVPPLLPGIFRNRHADPSILHPTDRGTKPVFFRQCRTTGVTVSPAPNALCLNFSGSKEAPLAAHPFEEGQRTLILEMSTPG